MDPLIPTELAVARILSAIAQLPNRRSQPRPGELPGDFDLWFDGGAVKNSTGYTIYAFADGSQALVSVLPLLSVGITLADGKRVAVSEAKA
jgi:hypothetical protein